MKKSDFKIDARCEGYSLFYKGELVCGASVPGAGGRLSIMTMINRIGYWKGLAEDLLDQILIGKAKSEIYVTMALIEAQQGARRA